jgi:hypothetical protein
VTQWLELTRKKVLERDLQELFESWPARDASRMFGVPDWLNAIGVPPLEKKERQRRSFGYDFTPDIEFIVGRLRYVLELKHGDKFEPLALAEVLHHAAWSKRYEAHQASHVVPVIVSQYNSWLRLAIDEYLRGVLRYIEAVALAGPGDTTIFAFDTPLAPWTVEQPPTWLAALDPRAGKLYWHHVAETDSWFGLQQKLTMRPTAIEDPYVWIMGASDRPVLLWEGWAAKRGEVWRSVRSPDARLDANGNYFLSGDGNTWAQATHSPTWLAAEAS